MNRPHMFLAFVDVTEIDHRRSHCSSSVGGVRGARLRSPQRSFTSPPHGCGSTLLPPPYPSGWVREDVRDTHCFAIEVGGRRG